MIHKTNFDGAKKLLLEYIKGEDYSKSFILAGWDGVGKTTLIEQVKAECDVTVHSTDEFSTPYEQDFYEPKYFVKSHELASTPCVDEVIIGTGYDLRRLIDDNHEVVILYPDDPSHPSYSAIRTLESTRRDYLRNLTEYKGDSWEEFAELIQDTADSILYLYLLKDEAKWATSEMLNALKEQQKKMPKFAQQIEVEIKEVSEAFSRYLY